MLIHQADTTFTGFMQAAGDTGTVRADRAIVKKTPASVLKMLPEGATPAQQDSAIQANFKPGKRIYNMRTDTLGMPGQKGVRGLTMKTLGNYKNPYFFQDSLMTAKPGKDRFGVAADPVPYSISGDNVITGLLILCFILAAISFSRSRRFIARQAKKFFYTPNERTTAITETTNEIRFQVFLVALTCLLGSIIVFFYTIENVSDTFVLSSQYQLIAIYFGIFVAYFVVKFILYQFVNWVFFDRRRNERWIKAQLFISAMEGMMFFPLVLLMIYFDLSIRTTVIVALSIIILVKLLSFYKCYIIFFRRLGGFLQIILYFCALELIPVAALYGSIAMTNGFLRINF